MTNEQLETDTVNLVDEADLRRMLQLTPGELREMRKAGHFPQPSAMHGDKPYWIGEHFERVLTGLVSNG